MEKLKKVRLAKGYSQTALAEKAELDRGYLCNIENGKVSPSFKALTKISDALGVSVKKILD